MSKLNKPTILVIDDLREAGVTLRRTIGEHAEVIVATPSEFTRKDLRNADLVLVDYELSEWSSAGAKLTDPPNGLALSAVIREQIGRIEGKATGVALYSGQIDQISGSLPTEVRSFVIARLNNLEWVFEKADQKAPDGIVALASAIQQLPRHWPEDPKRAVTELHRLVGLHQKLAFHATAVDDVSACHPPIHEFSKATHALAIIRWMAHRILPYPTFLIDDVGLAARLRLDVSELRSLLDGRSRLAHALGGVEYQGIMRDLSGRHWWRSGLDRLVFDWTSGAGGAAVLHTAICELAGKRLPAIEQEVVPALNEETDRPTELVAISDAVRLRLDDWPAFADDAWVNRKTVVHSSRLRGLVVPTDVELLDRND